MTKFARMAALAAAATIAATPALAVPVGVEVPAPAGSKPQANVTITKPLTLSRDRDLNFGSVAVFATDTISIDADTGAVTCGNTPGNLTCTGSPVSARYRVTGNNNHMVTVNYYPTTITNGTDDLTFTPNGQTTVDLANSGSVGTLFTVGGEILIDQSVSEGLYTGDIEVTVEY
jgi:spore coat protein U-like protein